MGRASRSRADRKTALAPPKGRGQWIAAGLAFLIGVGAAALLSLGGRSEVSPEPAPAIAPAALQAHVERAKKHMDAQELAEAQQELEKARALAPRDAEVAFLLGQVAYSTLQMEAAERHFRRVTELDPRSAAAQASLAMVLLELGQAALAAEAARRAMELDPQDPRVAALLGKSLLRLGQPKEAAELLETGLKAGLRGAERHATLGRARDLMDQPEAALHAFQEALKQDPQLPLVHYWRAECLRKLGRAEEAERALEAYRKCQDRMERITRLELRLRHDADDVPTLLELARLRVERGVPRQAVPPVARAEQLAPGSAEVRRVRQLVQRAIATTRDVES